jgi:hypothetical protein
MNRSLSGSNPLFCQRVRYSDYVWGSTGKHVFIFLRCAYKRYKARKMKARENNIMLNNSFCSPYSCSL